MYFIFKLKTVDMVSGLVLDQQWEYRDIEELRYDLQTVLAEQAENESIYYRIVNGHGKVLSRGHQPAPILNVA